MTKQTTNMILFSYCCHKHCCTLPARSTHVQVPALWQGVPSRQLRAPETHVDPRRHKAVQVSTVSVRLPQQEQPSGTSQFTHRYINQLSSIYCLTLQLSHQHQLYAIKSLLWPYGCLSKKNQLVADRKHDNYIFIEPYTNGSVHLESNTVFFGNMFNLY